MEYNAFIQLIIVLVCINVSSATKKRVSYKEYFMTQDCKEPPYKDANNEKRFTFELESAALYSHHFTQDRYPERLKCEVIIHVPDGMRIMLRFDRFNVPSENSQCYDNYLYVFDSNTPLYSAMLEAGGQTGLCQSIFPQKPIFSSKSYMTIVFKSTVRRNDVDGVPGFRLILTAIDDTPKSGVCKPGGFLCSQSTNPGAPQLSGALSAGYCISEKMKCDGVANCVDGRDEKPGLAKCGEEDNSLLARFLSLGVFASIGIVVGCIVFLAILIGILIRCCSSTHPKALANGTQHHPPGPVPGSIPFSGPTQALCLSDMDPSIGYPPRLGGLPLIPTERGPQNPYCQTPLVREYTPPASHHYSPHPYRKSHSPHTTRTPAGSTTSHHDYVPTHHVTYLSSSQSSISGPSRQHHAYASYPSHPPPSQQQYQTSVPPARCHTPTSSRSGKSGRSRNSGVTYHLYGPTPPIQGRQVVRGDIQSQNQQHLVQYPGQI